MAKILVFDLSKVILFSNDKNYYGDLNPMHDELKVLPGFKFFEHFNVNQELLNWIKKNSSKIIPYLFSGGDIQEDPELIESGKFSDFKKVISLEKIIINRIKASRKEKITYFLIANDLKLEPEDITFIDDNEAHIAAATSANWKALHYSSNEQIIPILNELIQ